MENEKSRKDKRRVRKRWDKAEIGCFLADSKKEEIE